MRLYGKYERQILNFAERYARGAFRLVTVTVPEEKVDVYIESREELLYAINSMSALTTEEKALLNHGIAFKDMTVKGSMTPRSVIASIGKKELLGPLVLNDLHKTGHSRFPVIDGDLDHIVGMLYIQDLLVIGDRQRSSTVEKAMEPRVFYVHEDQSLQHALSAFLRTHHHLFVVVNEFQETVGLLSLEDVIEALIGRKIVGEFDEYADLRSVAEKAAQVKKRDRGDQEV